MFPTDNEEFLLLYAVYLGLFLILALGTFFSKKKIAFKNNLIFFLSYALIMALIFLNNDNFKHGSSLVVLFFGSFFVVLHLVIFVLRRLYLFMTNRDKRNF